MRAAWENDIPKVNQILQREETDIDSMTPSGMTALMYAAWKGNLEVVKILLAHHANPRIHGTESTPLLCAIRWEPNDQIVRLLLDFGADPNAADIYGWTPLMGAAPSSSRSIIEMLLNSGADPRIKNPDGKTAAEFLAPNSAGYSSLKLLLDQHTDKLIDR